MSLIADILMIAGALGAAFYCMVLSRRLSKFTDLEKGVGGAVAVLSMQVDDLTKTLERARKAAGQSSHRLEELTVRGEEVASRLELMMASLHDLPEAAPAPVPVPAPAPKQVEAAPIAEGEAAAPVTFSSRQAREPEMPSIFSSKRLALTGDAA
jgi:hypothetical protein